MSAAQELTDRASDQQIVRRILLGITGSSGAFELPQVILWLKHQQGIEVKAIMTRQATTIITPRAVAVTSGNPVTLDGEGSPNDTTVPHIDLPSWADLFLIYPATADLIGKAANGIADNVLTTCILAATCPIVFAPCMNERMWYKPTVQRNLATLRADGYGVIPPVEGQATADGTVDIGATPEIEVALAWAINFVRASRKAPSANGVHHQTTNGILVEAQA
jgi:phosphopantothenoylcysteine decarboxylase/phosphopantothenate--cysteine ligase